MWLYYISITVMRRKIPFAAGEPMFSRHIGASVSISCKILNYTVGSFYAYKCQCVHKIIHRKKFAPVILVNQRLKLLKTYFILYFSDYFTRETALSRDRGLKR